MHDLIYFIEHVLGPISTVFGILSAVPIFWTWYSIVWGKKKRHRRWHEQATKIPGNRPSVLIVDLLPDKDVTVQVEHFMKSDEKLKSIPQDRVFKLSRSGRLNLEDMADFHRQIVEVSAEIVHSATDVLHVFLASPVSAAAMVGAEFANAQFQVMIYQAGNGNYVNFGLLKFRV